MALHAAVESAFPDLRRSAQLFVWKSGLATSTVEATDLADELLQEAIVRALGKAATFDPTRPVRSWVLGFVANIIHERRRAWHRERPLTASLLDAQEDETAMVDFDQVANAAERDASRLNKLLDLLPPADRQVLTLRYVAGLSGRELAAELGIKESAARVRLSRALDRLRQAYHRAERAGAEDR